MPASGFKSAAEVVGGRGGGKPDMAQAGGKHPEKLPEALDAARKDIATLLRNNGPLSLAMRQAAQRPASDARTVSATTRCVARLQRALEGLDGRVVVRLLGDFLDLLGVDDFAVLVEHEHAAGQDLQLFDQHAPVLAEAAILIVAESPHVLDVLGAAEAVHGKRQIEADRDGVDLVAQRRPARR